MTFDSKTFKQAAAVALVSSAAVVALSAWAYPFSAEQLAEQEKALLAQVDKGYHLWHGSRPDMTDNGLACGNCHPDAAASNPQTFPKYVPMFAKVVPFREMVNWCIETPQGGQALDVNGDDMTAMEAYAFYLHRGKPIEPGLASRQTSPVVVESGTGYPRTPTGLGVDK
jgi:thiosulfate dehydrogenase